MRLSPAQFPKLLLYIRLRHPAEFLIFLVLAFQIATKNRLFASVCDFHNEVDSQTRHMRGRKPRDIESHPKPLWSDWVDMPHLSDALQHHMERHGDTDHHLERVLASQRLPINKSTIRMWRTGVKSPSDAFSLRVLKQLEDRYRLGDGYFRNKVPKSGRAPGNLRMPGISQAERRRLAWHLPEDFDQRPRARREEILNWVRTVIISGSTEYRRYQAAAMRHRYAVKFDLSRTARPGLEAIDEHASTLEDGSELIRTRVIAAPAELNREIPSCITSFTKDAKTEADLAVHLRVLLENAPRARAYEFCQKDQ